MKNQIKTLLILIGIITMACESHDPNEAGLLVPLTVTEDTSLPSIEVNNTQLHSEAFGNSNNPMILVIHGGPGADYGSLLNCKDLVNEGYYVVFYDQRGSGYSKRHDRDIYTTQLFIDDLEAVINFYRADDQKLILLGHSWGAMLAAAYVNSYPTEVDGLILAEPGGLTWEDTETYINRSNELKLFAETSNDFVYIDQFLTSSDHNLMDYKFAARTNSIYYPDNMTGDYEPIPYWRNGAACFLAALEYVDKNPFDFTTNLDQYTPNVLFIYSELNIAYGLEHAELVSSPFSNLILKEVKDAGHEMIHFGWTNTHSFITDYLSTLNLTN